MPSTDSQTRRNVFNNQEGPGDVNDTTQGPQLKENVKKRVSKAEKKRRQDRGNALGICLLCGQDGLLSSTDHNDHDALRHPTELRCHHSQCGGRTFLDMEALQTHLSIEHNTPSFECATKGCKVMFSSLELIQEHYESEHKKRLYADGYEVCCRRCHADNCGRVFATEAELVDHKTFYHSDFAANIRSNHYRCQYTECNYESSNHWKLGDHIVEAHLLAETNLQGVTDTCQPTRRGRVKGMRTADPLRCIKCGKDGFKYPQARNDHVYVTHLDDAATICKHSKCGQRGPTYLTSDSLRDHLWESHAVPSFMCPECQTRFATKHAVHAHKQDDHDRDTDFRCREDGCGKPYEDLRQFTKHRNLMHPGVKKTGLLLPWLCQASSCSEECATENELQEHVAAAHGLGPAQSASGLKHDCKDTNLFSASSREVLGQPANLGEKMEELPIFGGGMYSRRDAGHLDENTFTSASSQRTGFAPKPPTTSQLQLASLTGVEKPNILPKPLRRTITIDSSSSEDRGNKDIGRKSYKTLQQPVQGMRPNNEDFSADNTRDKESNRRPRKKPAPVTTTDPDGEVTLPPPHHTTTTDSSNSDSGPKRLRRKPNPQVEALSNLSRNEGV